MDTPWKLAKATCTSILEVIFQRVNNGSKILVAINFALNKGPFWEGSKTVKNFDQKSLESAILEVADCKLAILEGENSAANDAVIVDAVGRLSKIVVNGSS